jgi:FkbM family methyltransferase
VNPWVIRARSVARKIGLIALINRLRPHEDYEQRVHESLMAAVKPGDVVWDVGANVGLYTELFCRWVGEQGTVVAFEPYPESCEQIHERLPHCGQLQVENIALGKTNAAGRLVTSPDSVQNHIETEANLQNDAPVVPVNICRGDTVRDRLGRTPNVIKVDVEGFEEEVIQGMGEMLLLPELRSILVEVHFAKLEQRGRLTAPSRIRKSLDAKGFRTRWVDASHLYATR